MMTDDAQSAPNGNGLLHELRIRQAALETRNEELEEANRQLEEEKRRYRRLFDNAPVGYINLNSKGLILAMNLTAPAILGYTRGQLLRSSLFRLLEKGDRQVLSTHLHAVLNDNDIHVCNLKLERTSHRVRYIQLHSQRDVWAASDPLCYSTITDITDRRQNRRALVQTNDLNESIFQSISEPQIVVNDQLHVLSVNPAFLQMFGIEAEEAEGKSVFELATGLEKQPELRKGIESMLNRKGAFKSAEVFTESLSLGRRHLRIQARPLSTSKDSGRILIIIRDLTEQKKTELRMRRLMRELEEINRQLSAYTSVVSHDLRSPLQVANNYLQFLKEDLGCSLPERQRNYLEGIGAAVSMAREMVNELLTLSRIRRAELNLKRTYLGPLVGKLVKMTTSGADIELSVCNKWPAIITEPTLLSQILLNLLDNAVKYNNSGTKTIELNWRELPESRLELIIRDNGPGIPFEQQERIFKPFKRLHSRDTVEGSGLGLSIARAAAVRLGGSIELNSQVGEGSTFLVRLPRDASETEAILDISTYA